VRKAPTTMPRDVALVFAPLDKRALGLAVGVVLAITLASLTVASLLIDTRQQFPLALLSEFLVGYEISVRGAAIGGAWMFFIGFVWGWFLAFCRNLVFAIWLVSVNVRADVEASRTFLDHI
jgi:hypothetical protein